MAQLEPLTNYSQPQAPGPTMAEVLGASFQDESGFVSMFEEIWRSNDAAEPDPNFQLGAWLNENPQGTSYIPQLLGVRSSVEAEATLDRIKEEELRRQVRAASGLTGFVTDLAASILSPSTFLPLGAAIKGVRGVGRLATYAAGGAAFDEGVLQATSLTRTPTESAVNVAGAAVLGTVLGGAIASLTPAQRAAAVQNLRTAVEIPNIQPGGSSIGARAVNEGFDDPTEIGGPYSEAARGTVPDEQISRRVGAIMGTLSPEQYSNAGIGARLLDRTMRTMAHTSPVMRGLMQNDSAVLRGAVSALSNSGIRMSRHSEGIATARGGTVEDRVGYLHNAYLARALTILDEAHTQYQLGKSDVGGFDTQRAQMLGLTSRQGKMSSAEFNEAVWFEAQNPSPNAPPEVQAAAQKIVDEFYTPLLERMKDARLLPEGLDVTDVKGAMRYVNHIFDKDAIELNPTSFIEMVARSYNRTLQEMVRARREKMLEANRRTEQDIEDLARSPESTRQLIEEITAERSDIAETEAADIRDEMRALKRERTALRRVMKKGTNQQRIFTAGNRIEEIDKELETLDQLLDDDAREMLARDNALRRRHQLLVQNIASLSDRQLRVYDRLNKLEEANIKALERLTVKTQKFLKDMERWSDEEFDDALARLEDQIENDLEVLRNAEEDLDKFVEANPELIDETMPGSFTRRIQRFRREVFPGGKLQISTEAQRANAVATIDEFIAYRTGGATLDFQRPEVVRGELAQVQGEAATRETAQVQFPNGAVVPVRQMDDGGWKLAQETEDDPFLGDSLEEVGTNVRELAALGELADEAFSVRPRDVEGLSPQQLASLQRLRTEIAQADINDINVLQPLLEQAAKKLERLEKISASVDDSLARLHAARSQGPERARATIREFYRDTLQEVDNKNASRHFRQRKLLQRADKLDPERARERIRALEEKTLRRVENLRDSTQKFAPEWTDFERGEVDFTEFATEKAQELYHRIIGQPVRAIGMDLYAEQGPELARALDIPLEEKSQFLFRDMDKVMRIYARQVVPDTELKRALGDVNGAKVLSNIEREYQTKINAVDRATPDAARELGWDGRGDVEQWRAKELRRLNAGRRDAAKIIEGIVQRMRHQRGRPVDGDSFLYRGGMMLAQLNTSTMMGNVLVSSLVDPAVTVSRYGINNVFRHALRPYINNLKAIKMTRREARYAGINDIVMQDRHYQINDLVDDATVRRSRPEKATAILANKVGVIGLFSRWTQMMNDWTAPIAIGRMLDAVEAVQTGSSRHVKMDEARAILAEAGFTPDMLERLWAQRGPGKLEKIDDLWVPTAENWTTNGVPDTELIDTFRSAIQREVRAAVVTPGVERPLFTDSNLAWKLITQFQSFMWSSHAKVVIRAFQMHDYAVLQGFATMIPLGALGYFVDSIARGEEATTEMQNADLAKWVDEIIARSPFLGVLAQGKRIGDQIPGVAPYINFSDEGTRRRWAGSLVGAVAGPSVGTVTNIASIIQQLDQPTQGTAADLRRLIPYNNVTYMRWLFDAAVENAPLPRDRSFYNE